METFTETVGIIRNKVCIVCGMGFERPRAGKLYCSPRCKQFACYHKVEIIELETARKGISAETVKISLREFDDYSSSIKKLSEYNSLLKRQQSTYLNFDKDHSDRLKELKIILPGYLKNLTPPTLTIEKWSFIKILYPNLCQEEFLNLLSSFSYNFYNNLEYGEPRNRLSKQLSPIQNLFNTHIQKIVEGKILFI